MAPCATDHEDHENVVAFGKFLGADVLAQRCDFLVRLQCVRFSGSSIGNLVQSFLEKMKKAHRTRADGWAAQRIAMIMIM